MSFSSGGYCIIRSILYTIPPIVYLIHTMVVTYSEYGVWYVWCTVHNIHGMIDRGQDSRIYLVCFSGQINSYLCISNYLITKIKDLSSWLYKVHSLSTVYTFTLNSLDIPKIYRAVSNYWIPYILTVVCIQWWELQETFGKI